MNEITVETIYYENKKRLKFEVYNNDNGFDRIIKEPELNRPALALTGFVDVFTHQRIQLIGNTELAYMDTLSPEARKSSLRKVFKFDMPCIVVTDNNVPPPELVEIADEKKITIFRTVFSTT
ncbi:HPr kinase/phosphorylase, partial [candidate division KSB1 bacterium]|nr:HPr kinase/phosphorylase [candidate division KSB1 bacterium]